MSDRIESSSRHPGCGLRFQGGFQQQSRLESCLIRLPRSSPMENRSDRHPYVDEVLLRVRSVSKVRGSNGSGSLVAEV